ncbi:MAG: hypothetical protein RLZZ383_1952 [Pseudomonadota bacterium]|jgi:hypothetical protein
MPRVLPLIALIACGGDAPAPGGGDGTPDTTSPGDVTCVDDRTFFREQLWPEVLGAQCIACHAADGLARESALVLASPARPDHLDVDQALLSDLAGLQRDGTSVLLLKPLGEEGHGGGVVITRDSDAFRLLQAFVDRVETPITCPPQPDAAAPDDLALLTPVQTFRKAALLLAGRLPQQAEVAAIEAGGLSAMDAALDRLMEEEAFYTRIMELFNDLLLTDRYLRNRDGIGIVDDDVFPTVYWYEAGRATGQYDAYYVRTHEAIAREPLQLIAHVLREHRPFTEVLTADYTVVNAYSANAYGVGDATLPDVNDPATLRFREARLAGWPHAGLLSTPAFYNRFPTTETNRNRHRAWKFLKTFLATDVLAFAERPIDPTTSSVHNPTLNDPQCTVCHATLDPVAGLFQDFDEDGHYAPPEQGWYADMTPPAWAGEAFPAAERGRALPWLAGRAVEDPRFALATVQNVLTLITGQGLQTAGRGADAGGEALRRQDAFVDAVATDFRAGGYELRDVLRAVVRSPWFRADADAGASADVLETAGLARWLTPEELSRKIAATTGLPWTRSYTSSTDWLQGDYKLLYGGIDAFAVTTRLRAPNGVMASIDARMATDIACRAVPQDLALPRAARRLLPNVEARYTPTTPDGFAVPEAEALLRANLRDLHLRLLGETIEPGGPEEEASYALWLGAWQDLRAAIATGAKPSALPSACQANEDPFSGVDYPTDRRVRDDADGTVRAWMAVVAYLLTDARFLTE